jgi:hypothetical protein
MSEVAEEETSRQPGQCVPFSSLAPSKKHFGAAMVTVVAWAAAGAAADGLGFRV